MIKKTGIQFQQFNTIYQLYEHVKAHKTELQNKSMKSFTLKYQEFMDKSSTRAVLPVIGLVIITVLFTILTGGRIIEPLNVTLLLSQTYMLMIASSGVFLIMTMGCLDFSQGSMLGIASIVVYYLSFYSLPLAIIGGMVTGAAIGAINGFFPM